MARFTTLYSGSSGNAGVVEENGRFLMVDMGCSCRATCKAMAEVGLEPEALAGILVTHEHIDHIRGLKVFLKRYPVRLYASLATLDALWRTEAVPEETEMIAVDGRQEEIAGFAFEGFATSHDSAGCCGFRITTPSGAVMAIATDLGVVDVDVYQNLQAAGLVALEANYDRDMLRTGPYPAMLKQRIASKRGHLSNEMSAKVVADLVAEGCRSVHLCHLSQENNLPHLVAQEIENAFLNAGVKKPPDCRVQVAPRHSPGEWLEF